MSTAVLRIVSCYYFTVTIRAGYAGRPYNPEGMCLGNVEHEWNEDARGDCMPRPPAVAGQFYDGTKSGLTEEIERCFLAELGPGKLPQTNPNRVGSVLGLVAPHAGYYYSGSAAAFAYAALADDGIPDIAVLLGPNHYGRGAAVAVSPADVWMTPLGDLQTDEETAEAIISTSSYASADEIPHAREHSIEAQLPFLQYIGGNLTEIIPISIAHLTQPDAQALVDDLGNAVAEALSEKAAVVIASTDFTHYETKTAAEAADALALDRILALNPKGLIEVVYDRNITMCGAIGVAVMLQACKQLGARSAEQLTYYTSGDVSGDTSQVVGYGSVCIRR